MLAWLRILYRHHKCYRRICNPSRLMTHTPSTLHKWNIIANLREAEGSRMEHVRGIWHIFTHPNFEGICVNSWIGPYLLRGWCAESGYIFWAVRHCTQRGEVGNSSTSHIWLIVLCSLWLSQIIHQRTRIVAQYYCILTSDSMLVGNFVAVDEFVSKELRYAPRHLQSGRMARNNVHWLDFACRKRW